jgi:hypothetical protein
LTLPAEEDGDSAGTGADRRIVLRNGLVVSQ